MPKSEAAATAAMIRPSGLPDRPTVFGLVPAGRTPAIITLATFTRTVPSTCRGGSVYAAFAARTSDGRRQRRLVRRLDPQIRLTHKMFAARCTPSFQRLRRHQHQHRRGRHHSVGLSRRPRVPFYVDPRSAHGTTPNAPDAHAIGSAAGVRMLCGPGLGLPRPHRARRVPARLCRLYVRHRHMAGFVPTVHQLLRIRQPLAGHRFVHRHTISTYPPPIITVIKLLLRNSIWLFLIIFFI